jgi:hypothetical protein
MPFFWKELICHRRLCGVAKLYFLTFCYLKSKINVENLFKCHIVHFFIEKCLFDKRRWIVMSWQEEGVPRAPRQAEEGVPRAPRPAVAVPPTPANYVPQSLRPSQSAGALTASDEDDNQVRNLPQKFRIKV